MNSDCVQNIKNKLKQIKAQDIMSKFAITTTGDANLADVAHLMSRFKISGVPVIDKGKKICGIITATDLFKTLSHVTDESENISESREKNETKDFCRLPVELMMTKDICTVSEDASLYDIIRLMTQKSIHTLPVVSESEIVGIIGRRDVLNASYAVVREVQKE